MGFGFVAGVAQKHVRHGKTMVFAVLDFGNGKWLAFCRILNRLQEYLQFHKIVDINVRPNYHRDQAHGLETRMGARVNFANKSLGSER